MYGVNKFFYLHAIVQQRKRTNLLRIRIMKFVIYQKPFIRSGLTTSEPTHKGVFVIDESTNVYKFKMYLRNYTRH